MIRIGLGLSVCDRCGSVVYEPVTTTTTTTPVATTTTTTTTGAASTTLYLTDTANDFGTDLSTTHDVVTFDSLTGDDAGFIDVRCYVIPFNTSSWGEFGGSFKIKITGTLSNEVYVALKRMSSDTNVQKKLINIGPFTIGDNTVIIPLTNWDILDEGLAAADDLFDVGIYNDTATPTDSFTIDCTLATDTYLTLDAELDPQPWPEE
jgi:hypothetical protein